MTTVHAIKQIDARRWALLIADESVRPEPAPFRIFIVEPIKDDNWTDGRWTDFEIAATQWKKIEDIRTAKEEAS